MATLAQLSEIQDAMAASARSEKERKAILGCSPSTFAYRQYLQGSGSFTRNGDIDSDLSVNART